jgi:hypothetical protein
VVVCRGRDGELRGLFYCGELARLSAALGGQITDTLDGRVLGVELPARGHGRGEGRHGGRGGDDSRSGEVKVTLAGGWMCSRGRRWPTPYRGCDCASGDPRPPFRSVGNRSAKWHRPRFISCGSLHTCRHNIAASTQAICIRSTFNASARSRALKLDRTSSMLFTFT